MHYLIKLIIPLPFLLGKVKYLPLLVGIRAPSIIVKCATVAVGIAAVALGFLYKNQDRMLYMPGEFFLTTFEVFLQKWYFLMFRLNYFLQTYITF